MEKVRTACKPDTRVPAVWELAHSGQRLEVKMFSLRHSSVAEDPENTNLKIIVVQADDVPPTIVSNGRKGQLYDSVNKLAIRAWIGIDGDEDGWDDGRTIVKRRIDAQDHSR